MMTVVQRTTCRLAQFYRINSWPRNVEFEWEDTAGICYLNEPHRVEEDLSNEPELRSSHGHWAEQQF